MVVRMVVIKTIYIHDERLTIEKHSLQLLSMIRGDFKIAMTNRPRGQIFRSLYFPTPTVTECPFPLAIADM